MSRRLYSAGAAICVVGALLPLSANGFPAAALTSTTVTPRTVRVSVTSRGQQGTGFGSGGASVSADGRYVAFESWDSNLVPGDTNKAFDIFVRDTKLGTTQRISVSSSGAQATGTDQYGASLYPSISGDGRYVTFVSYATNLVPGDTNNALDVFVRDRKTGTTRRVDVSSSGVQADTGVQEGTAAVISGDGRYVTFSSAASNLVPGDTDNLPDVFVRDLKTGTTRLVSMSSTGGQENSGSWSPSISWNGRYVAFQSAASNLVSGQGNPGIYAWLFVRDMTTGTTQLVTKSASWNPVISGNGRYVALEAPFPGQSSGPAVIYVRDLQTSTSHLVSVSVNGTTPNAGSDFPAISGDGRYVAFESYASDLVPGDTNTCTDRSGTHSCDDVFVRDMTTGTTRRVDVSTSGAQTDNFDSGTPSISADGRYVGFGSSATNLVAGDTNSTPDVFLRGPLQ